MTSCKFDFCRQINYNLTMKTQNCNNNQIFLYLCATNFLSEPVVKHPLRQKEIDKCSGAKVKAEKYTSWQLLKYATNKHFGLDVDALDFTVSPNGKWNNNQFFFSISHSFGLVAVAISTLPVGVDLERYDNPKITDKLAKKVLCNSELALYANQSNKREFFVQRWCQKEALFKCLHSGIFIPNDVDTTAHSNCHTVDFVHNDKTFCIAVASDIDCPLQPIFVDDLQ